MKAQKGRGGGLERGEVERPLGKDGGISVGVKRNQGQAVQG